MIVVLLLLGALVALTTGLVVAGSGNLNGSFENVESERALWAAEAGCAQGLVQLKADSNWPGFAKPQTVGNTDLTFEVRTYRNPSPMPRGGVVPVGMVYLHSRGKTYRGRSREAGILVSTDFGAMSYAVLTKDKLTLDGALVDVMDPQVKLTLPGAADLGSVSADSEISLTKSYVDGNYDLPDTAGKVVTTGSTITGNRRTIAHLSFPDVVLPAGPSPESSPDQSFSGGTHTLLPGVYKTLTIDNAAQVSFSPGSYVVKELIVKNGGTLRYTDLSKGCDLFVTGKVEMINFNIFNDSHIPKNFRILAEETLAPDIKLDGTTVGFFVLYAPNSKVLVDNGAEIYGAVVGKEAEIKNGSKVHYDPASSAALDMGGGAVKDVRVVSHQTF